MKKLLLLTTVSAFAVCLVFLGSCFKEELITQSISGKVSLYLYDKKFQDNGMSVYLVSNDGTQVSETNDLGEYSFQDVPEGSYDLHFEHNGFGTYKIFNVTHNSIGPTDIDSVLKLQTQSHIQITQTSTSVVSDTVMIEGLCEPGPSSPYSSYLRVLFGRDPGTNPLNYEYYSPIYSTIYNPAILTFNKVELYSMGFQTGDKVYFYLAGESLFSNEYFDPNSGIQMFPNLNEEAGTGSFIVP